jgi:hypothetical protein
MRGPALFERRYDGFTENWIQGQREPSDETKSDKSEKYPLGVDRPVGAMCGKRTPRKKL